MSHPCHHCAHFSSTDFRPELKSMRRSRIRDASLTGIVTAPGPAGKKKPARKTPYRCPPHAPPSPSPSAPPVRFTLQENQTPSHEPCLPPSPAHLPVYSSPPVTSPEPLPLPPVLPSHAPRARTLASRTSIRFTLHSLPPRRACPRPDRGRGLHESRKRRSRPERSRMDLNRRFPSPLRPQSVAPCTPVNVPPLNSGGFSSPPSKPNGNPQCPIPHRK